MKIAILHSATRIFACATLVCAAISKVLYLTLQPLVFYAVDQVTGVYEFKLYLLAIVLESATVVVVLTKLESRLKFMLIAWNGAVFLLYRTAHTFLGIKEPCKCLGGLFDWLPGLQNVHEIETLLACGLFAAGALCYYTSSRFELS